MHITLLLAGVVTSINMLEQEMKKRGHEVYVFAPSKSIQPNENQSLYMLKSMPLIVARQYKNRVAAFYSRDVAKKIKELNLDIVHTQSEFSLGLFGKIISRKYDIPFIHTYHTMWEDYIHYIIPIKGGRNIYTKRFARTFSKNFATKAECIITPSKKTEKYLKYKCKIKNKPMYVIPTGIDIVPFDRKNFTDEQRNKLKSSLGINQNDKVILFLGRIAQEKSIDVIMDNMPIVFKSLPNTKFLIVGDGPSKDELQEQAKKLKIADKVIFTGKIPWIDVPKYYSIGDVFVNASVTETQGLTFIEAMASSVPIVAKYAPNLSEFIINNKNGILVKRESDFAKSIISVLTDQSLSNKLIENGLETAKMNSAEEFGDKLEMLYTEIINSYKAKKDLSAKEKEKQNRTLYKKITNKLLELTRLKK
ncbi:MAG: glycosyltransferase [Clostridia bacterium]|nr:glycosyltransferase [Clostridia bacterium]